MYSPTFRIWGYETNWGSFAQFTKVQAHQCLPKPQHLTWEAVGGLHAGRRHRLPHAHGLGAAHRAQGRRRADLGRRRRARLHGHPDRQGGAAAIPVAVVVERRQVRLLQEARRDGLHQPQELRPLGHAAALEGQRRLRRVAQGRARLRQGDLGRARRARKPAHRLRAPRRGHRPDLDLRLRHRRHGGDLRRHHRLQRRRSTCATCGCARSGCRAPTSPTTTRPRASTTWCWPARSTPACRAPSPGTNCPTRTS